MLFPQSVCLEEEDAAREASENHVTQHVNLSFPDLKTQNLQLLPLVYGLPTIDHIRIVQRNFKKRFFQNKTEIRNKKKKEKKEKSRILGFAFFFNF